MGKKIDLTGQRFGRLVVIKEDEERKGKNRRVVWECICDCGNSKKTTGDALTAGRTQSCGCLHTEKIRKDLTGMSFGRLTAIKPIKNETKQRGLLWECTCECGNKTIVLSGSLITKLTRSCGCLSREQAKENSKKAHDFHRENNLKEGSNLSNLTSKNNKSNTSGHKGISFDKDANKWKAQLGFKGKNYNLGRFSNIKDAIKARKEAEEKYFQPILEKYGKESN